MNQLELAEKIAREAHLWQFRRDGVTPYIKHVEAVVSRCKTDEEKAAAWLHDVCEDCAEWNEVELLKAGVEYGTAFCAKLMSKDRYEDYDSYIAAVSGNHVTRAVKIADILSNLADSPTDAQIRKYASALLILLA